LDYQTSGHYPNPATDPTPLTFSTQSGVTQNETYQSIGGQVKVTAQATASIGTVQDCVTFYVDGLQGGIPRGNVTNQLDSLYQGAALYPTDGTATSNLMTGVAMKESTY